MPPMAEQERKAIPIFGLGELQRSPFVSTVERINAVVEMTDDGRQQAAIFGLPGLTTLLDNGGSPARVLFMREGEDVFYTVQDDQVLSVTLAGTLTLLGVLGTTTGPVWIADNGVELLINDGVSPAIFNTATGVYAPITDIDYPTGALGATFHNSRFLVFVPTPNEPDPTIEGRVYASDPFAGLLWDGLNFFTPESVPDGIADVVRWKNDVVVFGLSSIEFWNNSAIQLIAGALGYQPIANGISTEVGLSAVRGWAAAGQQLFFLGRMRGQASVFEMMGYQPKQVSPPKLDADWASILTRSNAICTGYVVAGHPIFQITFPLPTAGGQTWAYDTSTQLWCERKSINLPYYRGLFAVTSKDRVFMSGAFVGRIFLVSQQVFTEAEEDMIFQVTSKHLLKEGDQLAVDECWVDMETGLGTTEGQGSNPQAMLQVSKDGGHVWGMERLVPIGKTGKYTARATRRRIGAARDIAIRLRITDPVPRRVTGAYLKLTPGVS